MTAIIILAAGASTRLGSAKQNLLFEGKTLLQRAMETAIASGCNPVIVTLGANAEVIKPTLKSFKIRIIYNEDWQEGMASSIRLSIGMLKKLAPDADSVILMLCDQPFVDESVLNQLIGEKTKNGIIAATYNKTIGVPVLFDQKYFDELLLLKGQEGAKKLLMKFADDVLPVPFPLGAVDIDTVEDYEHLK